MTPLDASATNYLPLTCNNPSTCDIPLTEHLLALAAATFAYQDLNDEAAGCAHVSARRPGSRPGLFTLSFVLSRVVRLCLGKVEAISI